MNRETLGLFGSCVLTLFLRTVFENTVNTILVFSENCFGYLNLVFSVFKKVLRIKHVLPVFLVLLCFLEKKTVLKNMN